MSRNGRNIFINKRIISTSVRTVHLLRFFFRFAWIWTNCLACQLSCQHFLPFLFPLPGWYIFTIIEFRINSMWSFCNLTNTPNPVLSVYLPTYKSPILQARIFTPPQATPQITHPLPTYQYILISPPTYHPPTYPQGYLNYLLIAHIRYTYTLAWLYSVHSFCMIRNWLWRNSVAATRITFGMLRGFTRHIAWSTG